MKIPPLREGWIFIWLEEIKLASNLEDCD